MTRARKLSAQSRAAIEKMLRRLDDARAVLARPGAHSMEQVAAAAGIVEMTGPDEAKFREALVAGEVR